MEKTFLASIPDGMKELRQWVVTPVSKGHKRRKVPHAHNHPVTVSSAHSKLLSYDEAVEQCHDGWTIGFVFGNGWIGVDLDNAVDENRKVRPWAKELIDLSKQDDALRIRSTSGTGFHLIGRKPDILEFEEKMKRVFKVIGGTHDGQHQEQVELNVNGGYFALNCRSTFRGSGGELRKVTAHVLSKYEAATSDDTEYTVQDKTAEAIEEVTAIAPDFSDTEVAEIIRELLPHATKTVQHKVLKGKIDDGSLGDLHLSILASRAGLDPQRAWDIAYHWRLKHCKKSANFVQRKMSRQDYMVKTLLKAYGGTAPQDFAKSSLEPRGWTFPFIMVIGAKPVYYHVKLRGGRPVALLNDAMLDVAFNRVGEVKAAAAALGIKQLPATIFSEAWGSQVCGAEVYLPGLPRILKGWAVSGGGTCLIPHPTGQLLNRYTPPPNPKGGDPDRASKFWLGLLDRLYPNQDEADHIAKYIAFKYLYPGRKVHHALVLGGAQGVGKDSLLMPLPRMFGGSNYTSIAQSDVTESFRQRQIGESVLLQISEAFVSGQGGNSGSAKGFANALKRIIAGHAGATDVDPDNLASLTLERVNEKFGWGYAANVRGVIIDTNYNEDALQIDPGDRRYFFVYSPLPAVVELNEGEQKAHAKLFDEYYSWLQHDGWKDLGIMFQEMDLHGWDPAAPPPSTEAKQNVIDAQRPVEQLIVRQLFRDFKPPFVTIPALEMWARNGGLEQTSEGRVEAALVSSSFRRQLDKELAKCRYTRAHKNAIIFSDRIRMVYMQEGMLLADVELLESWSNLEDISFETYLENYRVE